MKTPRVTYRIQLRPEFGFDDAAALADYLAGLGVSHLYASPYLHAAEGSTHGYDVVDPTRVSEALGGDAAHRRFESAAAQEVGRRIRQDLQLLDEVHRRSLARLLDEYPYVRASCGKSAAGMTRPCKATRRSPQAARFCGLTSWPSTW